MKLLVALLLSVTMIAVPAFAADLQLESGFGFTVQSGTWSYENGELVSDAEKGKGAWLVSEKTFADFDLELEFNTSTAFHVVVRGHTLPTGPVPEDKPVEILPHSNYGYSIAADERSPHIEAGSADNPSSELRFNEKLQSAWTTLRIQARGEIIEIEQNGKWETTLHSHAFTRGWLGFYLVHDQSRAGSVRIRNIEFTDHGHTGDWRTLFNGKDLDNWVEWGTETWTVKDGIIEGTSGPDKSEGYLATEETWSDFHVRGSFKILGDGNYGLFYHSSIAYNDENYPIISGIQTEVAPGTPSPSGWLYESYKRGWLDAPDNSRPTAYALNEGEWNEIEVMSKGKRVTTWVNGINVGNFSDDKPNYTKGAFALQLHAGGAEGILWKDLYVKEE